MCETEGISKYGVYISMLRRPFGFVLRALALESELKFGPHVNWEEDDVNQALPIYVDFAWYESVNDGIATRLAEYLAEKYPEAPYVSAYFQSERQFKVIVSRTCSVPIGTTSDARTFLDK